MILNDAIEYVEGLRPGLLETMAQRIGGYYDGLFGLGSGWIDNQRDEMARFAANYAPARDLLVAAYRDGEFVGSIAVEGGPEGALLRWLWVDPRSQGRGMGRELFQRALAFCEASGHATVDLWTVEELPTAVGLYQRHGFETIDREVDARYGATLTVLHMRRRAHQEQERREMTATMETEYVEGYRPGYLGRIAELHGVYYASAWGSGAEFEGMMAQEMREFLAHYQEGRDLLLTAHVDGRLVGSIAVEGSESERPGARLRWVIVDPAFHGRGLGKTLLQKALAFCRQAGFSQVYLWTVEGLPQSLGLYERAGFHVVERFPDDRYSVPHTHLRMELNLA